MRTRQPATTLEDQPIPVRAKLAAAWTSFMFLYAYVDILNFYTPGTVDDILDGRVFEFALSQTFSTSALTLMAVPIFMIVLSVTLPARVSRIANLIVAALYVPVTVFNLASETWLVFYGLGVALELILLALILRYAWTWPRTASSATMATSPDRESVGAQQQPEPKRSPRPVRSHLPRCRDVGLVAVGHQLPVALPGGAFQGPPGRSGHRMRTQADPHRRRRPQSRQSRRPRHWHPPQRAGVSGPPVPTEHPRGPRS